MTSTSTTTETQTGPKVCEVSIVPQSRYSRRTQYKYAAYLPVYDETTTFSPTEPFDFSDRGLLADKAKPYLLGTPNAFVTKLTPRVGTEIRGLQLSELGDEQKNELALLLAERGVVVFRDQDFKEIGPEKQKAFGQYFGKLHVHPVGAHVKDHIEFHNIYLGADNLYRAQQRSSKLTTTGYHSDVSYEHQSPALTMLSLLSVPHSGVRVHPVTVQKSLFVNPGFTRRIVGLKYEESEAILQLLFRHISTSADVQVRSKWDDRTVVLWDNRVTAHTAISDYDVLDPDEGLRYGFRITTLGEKPVGVNGLESTW
ncbi:hypothetical protein LTR10_009238 [Elasticomyces elasticus]|nr:hypothetical protein LTR10_009238 [Elasticomyces elasticus]